MTRFFGWLRLGLAGLALMPVPGMAQGISDPAEYPPLSYEGRQYVDSRGCVFIRAGVDGRVTWVPRVRRDRTQVCGFEPSLSAAGLAEARALVAPSAEAAPAPAPAAVTGRPRGAAPAASATASAAPSAPAAAAAARASAPRRAAAARPAAPAPAPRPVLTRELPGEGGCPNASTASRVFVNDPRLIEVRCVPQSEPIYAGPAREAAERVIEAAPAPQQVAPAAAPAAAPAPAPRAAQPAATAAVRKAPAPKRQIAPSGKTFVQIGVFGVAYNANRAESRLRDAGLPVQVVTLRQNGRVLKRVSAGPFADPRLALEVQTAARKAGFRDAFIR